MLHCPPACSSSSLLCHKQYSGRYKNLLLTVSQFVPKTSDKVHPAGFFLIGKKDKNYIFQTVEV